MNQSDQRVLYQDLADLEGRCHVGDCRQVMLTWPAAFADACITDPPYGDTSLDWDRKCEGWLDQVARVLKPSASIWVFGSMRFIAPMFAEMERRGFKYAQDLVWEKQNGTGFHNDRFKRVHEHAVQFYRGRWRDQYKNPQFSEEGLRKTIRRKARPPHTGQIGKAHYASADGGQRLTRSVIKVPNEHGRALHPTQKPLRIVAPLLRYSVPPGGIVVDPFFGSGTTGIAANMLGFRWVAAELYAGHAGLYDERTRQTSLIL